jgi:hypothetical protein
MKFFPRKKKRSRKSNGLKQSSNESRRLFFKVMGIGVGVGAGKVYAGDGEKTGSALLRAANYFADNIELTIFRPQDLLELKLNFIGYKKSADGKSLTRSGAPNLLIVTFPPQSIAEQAYEEKGTDSGGGDFDAVTINALNKEKNTNNSVNATPFNSEVITQPAKTYISGESRLVFSIPASKQTINLTAKDLLDWSAYKIEVSNRAACVPVYSIKDNLPVYDNKALSGDVKLQQLPGVKPVEAPKENPPVRDRNIPIKIIRNGETKSDTLKRTVQLNRDLRSATKAEAEVIRQNELPKAVVQSENGSLIAAALVNLKIGKTPRPVDESETSIEMPYRLFISPNQFAAWYHEHELKKIEYLPGQQVATYELWHSKLLSTNCDGKADKTSATGSIKTVRALWGTDIDGKWDKKPLRDYSGDGSKNNVASPVNKFVTALYNDDRHCIVHESSNYDIAGFTPKNVQVNNLMLTCLGAWLDAEMLVKRKELENAGMLGSLNLLKWKHIATLARDHYVEVVYAGNMLPFGHEAALVRITERKAKNNFAANYQRYFIVVNEEEKKYNPYNPVNGNFKQFPFSTVTFITTATPTIDPISKTFCELDDTQLDHQFIPYVNGRPYLFKLSAYDLDGNETGFEMPLVFVSTNITAVGNGYNIGNISKLCNTYNAVANEKNSKINFRGQKLSLARSKTKGDTNFETQSVSFNAIFTADESPGFRPGTKDIDIFIAAAENLTGKREAQTVTLVDDKNEGNIFAKLSKPQNVNFNGNSNKTGGSLAPNFGITALSKTLGAVGGNVNELKNMTFNPESFFDSSAKLFGVIELGKIIQGVTKAAATLSGNTVQSPIPALKNIETGKAFITQYAWTGAALKTFDGGFFVFRPKNGSSLKVETNLFRYKDTTQQNLLMVDSSINNFSVEIAKLAAVNFKKVGFKTGSNAKVDVTVEMDAVPLEFLGALTFVNELQKYIPADGFSDPPYLDITSEGVTTGYTLGLPDIQLGAFTLRHLSLGASVKLPFTGEPMSMRFNFCEKEQPFTLTVAALGGGGFFAIEFDMKGLRSLEAALEFGAAVSINLGVASGAVSIMGGIYFKVTVNANDTKTYNIEGYVRINGALSVLGLITASVEFLLTLAGQLETVTVNGKPKDKITRVWGTAKVKIKIEVFMFSKTITLTTTKEFAGAGADPTFGMMISEGDWGKYCDSFAA